MKLHAELLSSRVMAEIFRLLHGDREMELHLREIGRHSKLSLGTVQQELRKLSRLALMVRKRQAGSAAVA
jgi:hypothetical protein